MYSMGTVVKAMAGRDRNRFFCIVETGQDRVKLADGKSRPLERAKWKNVKHIQPTTTILEVTAETTNKRLRVLLDPFNAQQRPRQPEKEGPDFV